MIITLILRKNANFFAENWQKSQKIVIITVTPGQPDPNLTLNQNRASNYTKKLFLKNNLRMATNADHVTTNEKN
jgi:DNA polymerase II small subunit/DNA polymerase delta subunit B